MHSFFLRANEACELSELAKTPTEEIVSEPETEPPVSESGVLSDSDGDSDFAPEHHDSSMAAERWTLVGKRLHEVFTIANLKDDELPATASAVSAENWRLVGQRLHRVFAEAVSDEEQAWQSSECSQVQRWRHVGELMSTVFADAAVNADADW